MHTLLGRALTLTGTPQGLAQVHIMQPGFCHECAPGGCAFVAERLVRVCEKAAQPYWAPSLPLAFFIFAVNNFKKSDREVHMIEIDLKNSWAE